MIARLIGLAFAWLWLLVGASGAGAARVPIGAAGSLVIGIAGWRVVRRQRGPDRLFRSRYYVSAVLAEVIAIMAAQRLLASRGLNAYLFPVIGVIVGFHFIGLWAAGRQQRFLWLTGELVTVNLLAIGLPLSNSGRLLLAGLGSSACLVGAAIA